MTAPHASRTLSGLAARELHGLALAALVGALAGAAAAAFLVALDAVTAVRASTPRLVFALPAAGLVIGAVLARVGAPIRGGSNLVIDAVVDGRSAVPARLAPLVLLGTLATHLFGGSAMVYCFSFAFTGEWLTWLTTGGIELSHFQLALRQ